MYEAYVVWGETIEKISIYLVMAVALLSASVTAINVDDDPLTAGIFVTEETAFRFPAAQDTNLDSLVVGNDRALAFDNIWQKTSIATATNDLVIEKNQDSGNCSPCGTTCGDACIKVNLDQIKLGNREAMAFGSASAANYIKIVTNQQ